MLSRRFLGSLASATLLSACGSKPPAAPTPEPSATVSLPPAATIEPREVAFLYWNPASQPYYGRCAEDFAGIATGVTVSMKAGLDYYGFMRDAATSEVTLTPHASQGRLLRNDALRPVTPFAEGPGGLDVSLFLESALAPLRL